MTPEIVVDGDYPITAPSPEVTDGDAQVVDRMSCRKCGGPMHYEGYYRRNGGRVEYVALAICDCCDRTVSF